LKQPCYFKSARLVKRRISAI